MGDYDFIIYFVAIVMRIGIRSIWGAITWKMNDYKGYASNGFWWGFFLGLVGVIVVACKSNVSNYKMTGWKCVCGKVHSDYVTACACGRARNTVASVPAGHWSCSCGRIHAPYVSSCICGLSKKDAARSATVPEKATSATPSEQDTVNLLKEYKTLLDSGAITQEEFDAKKAQLLER